jgi:hypothetical protein
MRRARWANANLAVDAVLTLSASAMAGLCRKCSRVRKGEPFARRVLTNPKSGASANSATLAWDMIFEDSALSNSAFGSATRMGATSFPYDPIVRLRAGKIRFALDR